MHDVNPRDLGLTFGHGARQQTTTFADYGMLGGDLGGQNHPLWLGYREVEPTMVGLVAGSLVSLLDADFVASMQRGSHSPGTHMQGVWKTVLAAVFGDRATFDRVCDLFAEAHAHPSSGTAEQHYALLMPVMASVAQAHLQCGLLTDGNASTAYLRGLEKTVAAASFVSLPREGEGDNAPSLRALMNRGLARAYRPLMTHSEAAEAGVAQMLRAVLDMHVGGIPLRVLYLYFGSLIPDDVRDALELDWSKQNDHRFQQWGYDYAQKVASKPERPEDWFALATHERP